MARAIGEFAAPTRIVAGRGCARERLGAELGALGVEVAAVVVDRGFALAGLLEGLLAGVAGVGVPVCGLIGEDPDVAECEGAAALALAAGAQAVLAIGGGSALCAAKAVAIRLRNPAPLELYEGSGRLPAPPAPSIAVPTTAGSGSEVSNVVVLHDPGRPRHLVIRGRGYEPAVALLDGELLVTLPRAPMIAAALDALSHALESLWVRGSSRFSGALALAAAAALRTALPRALGGDVDAMQQLIEASAMANLACGNSGLGLVHALSSAVGVELPHGYQNGVLLPHVAAFNRDFVAPAVAGEIDALAGLYEKIGFEPRFGAGEVSGAGTDAMVAAAMGNPFRDNNRREAGVEELRGVLAAAGAGA
ncbi:MAG TPA: iron-containing alcohol dehydrogenase [Solirubrobacteraceae bacterium]|nr:iron-containing alcohol dehydrogenase [Solirubrobacteraceae bacterium]